ncbi:unnamed protein product [Brassica oleracea]
MLRIVNKSYKRKILHEVKILPLNDLKYSSSAWLQHLEKINILPPKHFSDSPKRLCIVSQNHKLESPLSLSNSCSLQLHLSSVVFAGF